MREMSHLALQVVGLFGPPDLHVIGKHRVLVQFLPVVLIAGEGLRVLGRHQMYGLRREVVLAAGHQGVLSVLLVAGQSACMQAVQETRVIGDASEADVLPFILQVVVFVVVLQKEKKRCR